MSDNTPSIPTLQALQEHLIELNVYLEQRESRQQQEQQRRAQQEAERAHIQRLEQEQQRLDDENAAESARLARERALAQARKQEQERIFADLMARRQRDELKRAQEEITAAKANIERFKTNYKDIMELFAGAFEPVLSATASPEHLPRVSQLLSAIEPSIEPVAYFLQAAASIGYEKGMLAQHLGIQDAGDFSKIAPHVNDFFRSMPATGMRDCMGLDGDGNAVAPWMLQNAKAWLQPSSDLMIFIGDGSGDLREVSYAQALDALQQVNAMKLCGRNTWKIPANSDLALLHLDNLISIGVNVPDAFWIEHATAQGRASAVSRANGRRIVTTPNDRFFTVFISF